jgi:3-hydroxyacyl-CoA dehydrogenase / enoyl-CoA hydratase / 3-hydroxybutyryl-CoA epimerase
MTNYKTYENFKLDTDADGILWLAVDRAGAKVNSLSYAVFEELDAIIDEVAQNRPTGVIIYSAKKQGFIAGADITQFTQLESVDQAYKIIRQAQVILDKLEALPMPTVAMINGFALGGGCELALACTYRIAEDSAKTVIGLPEVKLGIHPGWAGTVRLPKLIGAPKAMGIILPGRALKARAAAKMGMIDAAVPERELKRAARYFVMNKPPKHKASFVESMTNWPGIRSILGNTMRKKLRAKISEAHYPAPFAVINNWVKDGVGAQAQLTEVNSIAKLLVHPCSRNLVRVFFLQDQMKALAKGIKFKPAHVHVIGAGTMGGDIAAWCALRGMYVTVQDQSPERIAPAIKRAYKLFKKKLRKPNLVQAAMDRLQPDVAGDGVPRADVIIEAVFENLEVKQKIFKDLELRAKPEAVLATNTSSIPLDDISTVMQDPSRLIGIHFFNPVSMMPLVEVVKADKSDADVVKKGLAFVGKISRQPLPVKSSPGFLVNRVLMPYLMEAMMLLEEGVPAHIVDKAAMKFGMPMGPVTLADTVGLDVGLAVAQNLATVYGGTVPAKLQEMVKAGNLGKKSGQGFYEYKNGKKVSAKESGSSPISNEDITDRLVLRMVNESVACLREGVVDDKDLLDAGMIFGTGFAPFRGGPIHYAEARGTDDVMKRLHDLEKQCGERFKADAGWDILTKSPAKDVQEEPLKS